MIRNDAVEEDEVDDACDDGDGGDSDGDGDGDGDTEAATDTASDETVEKWSADTEAGDLLGRAQTETAGAQNASDRDTAGRWGGEKRKR